jgi:FdhE protein
LDLLALKEKEAMPFFDLLSFYFPQEAVASAFKKIGAAARKGNKLLAAEIPRIIEALENNPGELIKGFHLLVQARDTAFRRMAQKAGLSPTPLAFLIRNTLSPLIQKVNFARTVPWPGGEWPKGYCPVCGLPPVMGELDPPDGKRFLYCAFCDTKWGVPRLMCPFCDNQDPKKLAYFFSEEEKGYRVDWCENCRHYLKTADAREREHPVLPVEDLLTLPLDLRARKKKLKKKGALLYEL